VKGAREHNLKNITVAIPRDKLTVITGLSGSGKSTLAFDTLYAEGQRRYVESLSAYARQFLGLMSKPDVDSIEGLSPAISIEQKTTSKNPRSTVGTVTEIYDYLRLLFARIGTAHCPKHGVKISAQTPQKIAEQIGEQFSGSVIILAPLIRQKKGTYEQLLSDLHKDGFARARVNKQMVRTDDKVSLERYRKHDIEIVIDRMEVSDASRLAQAVELAAAKADGLVIAYEPDSQKERLFSSRLGCPHCDFTLEELQPRMFSFNSPFGACESCSGLGIKMEFEPELIIPDRSKSIADGAVAIYRNAIDGWRGQYLGTVARHFGFDVFTPLKDATKRQWDALMHGSDEAIQFRLSMKGGDANWSHKGRWEGLIPQSERLYKQTESEYRRRELEKFMRVSSCPACKGKRLSAAALAVKIQEKNIIEVTDFSVKECTAFFSSLALTKKEEEIAKQVIKEIRARLDFLEKVGLGYLTLSRNSGTLSGGEGQRIRLATQIGANLMGVLYILDEPSIGLHQRDNAKLINTLHRLRDLGNTLVVVEHDEDTIRSADYVVDMGPGAGIHGGQVVSCGTPQQIAADKKSLTGQYLAGREFIHVPQQRRKPKGFIEILCAAEHNLKNIDVKIPLGVIAMITGVSGSGKSTLIYEILYKAMMQKLHGSRERPGKHAKLTTSDIDKVIVIDQSPIGKTPRSNPATYTKVFDDIRSIFSQTEGAKVHGFKPGRFSFNVPGGRCEACQGDGLIKIEMNFLPDVYVQCEECKGKRYNHETLSVHYKGRSIADVLDMSIEEALAIFSNVPSIKSKLQMLSKVGLEYVKVGQSSTTLSGGEAQRIKLTRELAKRGTGKTLYLLDEPTTGLHFHDVKKLIAVLQELVNKENTVVVIEHNLDMIKSADYLLDLGPEGGDAGGEVVAFGTPEEVAASRKSYTGQFLKKMLSS